MHSQSRLIDQTKRIQNILMKEQKNISKLTKASNIKFEVPNMEEGHNAIEMTIQRYSIFNQQNVETGHFDVTFLFNEKELHAHSFVLWSASEVFEAMLFGAWAKNEPIPITGHSMDDFKELLIFLYLGKCTITMDNVMGIVDLAEFYNVQLLKDKCDQFLTNLTPTAETVFTICETLKIYSLQNALENMYEFIAINAASLLKNKVFLQTTKEIVLDIVKMERLVIKEEELFDAVYKWAEFQHQNQDSEKPASIKDLLSNILPHIRFPVMDIEYLHGHIVPLGGLFESFTELSQILKDAGNFQKKTLTQPSSKYPFTLRKSFNIELRDTQGNLAHAYINDNKIIEMLSNRNGSYNQAFTYSSINNYYDNPDGAVTKECHFGLDISKPTTKTSTFFDLNSCKIYLIRNSKGKLAVKDFSPQPNVNPEHLRRLANQMAVNNGYNDPNEYDIIARVYCEKINFRIDSGCYLKLISENPVSPNNRDPYGQNYY